MKRRAHHSGQGRPTADPNWAMNHPRDQEILIAAPGRSLLDRFFERNSARR